MVHGPWRMAYGLWSKFVPVKKERIITEDGSHSFWVPELNETYHSRFGAIQESKHVYINAGLKALPHVSSIQVLEVGFGTGLNALLTLLEPCTCGANIDYTTLEPYPLTDDEYSHLNYGSFFDGAAPALLQTLHEAAWQQRVVIAKGFVLNKLNILLQDFVPQQQFHLVYFDAFAPAVQPELWTTTIFEKIYNAVYDEGIVVTYCSKVQVQKAMKEAGFAVEKLAGPTGKREMIRARKNVR